MLVFITHPKYFNEKEIENKKVELIYIFNSKILFNKLSQKYKCVNIGSDGIIKDENFFPKQTISSKANSKLFDLKMGLYSYFKKKYHQLESKYYVKRRGYKDSEFRLVTDYAQTLYRQDISSAIYYLERETLNVLYRIITFENDKFVKRYEKLILSIFQYTNSFYRAYIYSFSIKKRGVEIFGDVFKYNLFLNAVLYYHFDKYDIYEDTKFKYGYLKVLSRLFIEQIHSNDVKGLVKGYLNEYKEAGVL